MPPAARKTEQNSELPVEPVEPKPESPEDLIFTARIYPLIFQGDYVWKWELLNHTHKTHIGDFSKIVDPDSYGSRELAEEAARRHVRNIRHVAGLKLNQPSEYQIEL